MINVHEAKVNSSMKVTGLGASYLMGAYLEEIKRESMAGEYKVVLPCRISDADFNILSVHLGFHVWYEYDDTTIVEWS